MRSLRGPGGCPWDQEQTLESLRPYVIEEAHEVVEAIERGDPEALCGEIGDLVFEGVFLAQLCAEQGTFTVTAALDTVVAKLVRRHPHVFGEAAERLGSAGRVKERWEAIKAEERAARGEARRGLLDGLPAGLPALLRAHALGRRAGAGGFDWAEARDVLGKIEEEIAEVRAAMADGHPTPLEEEIGDLLFAMANLARKLDIEPEGALRRANAKFTRRFAALEARFEAAGRPLADATPAELDAAWEAVKAGERDTRQVSD